MSAAYLIDGYNLLHVVGLAFGRLGPHGLEKARQQLLALVHAGHATRPGAVTIVFDAAGAPASAPAEEEFRGLHVRYAVGYDQADDLIEELIRRASSPRELHVVSNDHRIQGAAQRRKCPALSCQAYLERLIGNRSRPASAQAPEKSAAPSQEETERWLAEFGNLANEPGWKELFNFGDLEDG